MIIFRLVSWHITLVTWNVKVLFADGRSLYIFIHKLITILENPLERFVSHKHLTLTYPIAHVVVACAIHIHVAPLLEPG